ncbi:phosphatase PAP2 family protein [Roseitranquillus sediminis]|uniref:phosphatase PAP2 family protein n=1 Tax=Roseitranquillus sediminis TaxID=2809051 RepID=UPI001D0C1A82|nr:phosphatase PAP2 family protein [Roseitranquillus sediminis]MBM9593509.1 phosphatase PAP2 family protein [Roseitranquillus sediminis]
MAVRLAVVFALVHLVFATWPGIDLWISDHFAGPDGSFGIADSDEAEWLRHMIWNSSIVLALASLVLWLSWLTLGRAARVPARLWGWIAAVYLVGPGILVNLVLKEHWGRARPDHVFSGESRFSPPFQMVDECARNCSFVSGEASAAATLAIVTGVIAWPHLGPRGRRRAVWILASVAVLGSALRVVSGRHFTSDVIFAGFLVAFVALGLYRLLDIGPARRALTLPALRHDLGLLRAMARQRWRRLLR